MACSRSSKSQALAATMVEDDVLFDFRSDQDYKDSSHVIAELDQGGLSLPDRDFYLLQDPKSRKLRKPIGPTSGKCLPCWEILLGRLRPRRSA